MVTDLIFDFFGTLVGYTPGVFVGHAQDAAQQVLRSAGFEIQYERFASEYRAASEALEAEAQRTRAEYHMRDVGVAFFERCFGAAPALEVVDRFVDAFVWEWNRGTVFDATTAPLLQRLAGRYRLSIISNTHYPELIHRNLETLGAAGLLAQVVTSVEFGRRKPDPSIFRHALDGLGIHASDAIYVGDNPVDDVEGATGAGLRSVLLDSDGRWGEVQAERIARLTDLEALLG